MRRGEKRGHQVRACLKKGVNVSTLPRHPFLGSAPPPGLSNLLYWYLYHFKCKLLKDRGQKLSRRLLISSTLDWYLNNNLSFINDQNIQQLSSMNQFLQHWISCLDFLSSVLKLQIPTCLSVLQMSDSTICPIANYGYTTALLALEGKQEVERFHIWPW